MNLFYRKLGQGQPLIILHGLFGSSDNWMTMAKKMSSNFEIWIPDLRNHGQSPHDPTHNYDSMTLDLFDFIKEHSIVKPIIIGHSMGGVLAMNFSCTYPELLSHLIVVDISPNSYLSSSETKSEIINHQMILNLLRNMDFSNLRSRKQLEDFFSVSIKNYSLRNLLLKNIKRDKDGIFVWKINIDALYRNMKHIYSGLDYPIQALQQNCSIPTLFIKGEHSMYVSDSDTDTIKRLFPEFSIVTILGAGHWVHVDQPELFIKEVYEFLNVNQVCSI